MIYMESTLTLQPGKMAAYRQVEGSMYPLMEKAGMKVIGSWVTVIGNANELSVIVASEDMGKLEKSAMALTQSKEYQAVMQKMEPLLISHTRRIMMPMPTSPLK